MHTSLAVGLKFSDTFVVPASKTVPNLYPEAAEFQEMPEVLATGFLVGLVEWTCIKAIKDYLDWPEEQSLGTHIAIDHLAATPPGLEITTSVELIVMEGKKLVFEVEAHDGVDLICKGRHDRFVVQAERFNQRVQKKSTA
jgi:fluoroacetyl-CoA thioesterase